jgi:two-component system sensor histidine kinase/response regulator
MILKSAINNIESSYKINDGHSKGVILVADDSSTNLEILTRILTRGGYEVVIAEDGIEALEVLNHISPDLILLDVDMPRLDGYGVCQRIKADDKTSHIPVIFISALDELGDKVRGFEVGAVDYILKPFNVEELMMRVASQILLAKQQQEIMRLGEIKDNLIRTVSHDLKNPIHIVMGYAGLLLDANDLSPDQIAEMALQIHKSADKMYRLVTNLLDLTQIEAGVMWDFQSVSINSLMEDVLLEYLIIAQQKEIAIYWNPPDNSIKVNGDPMRLQQVFNNLISNAIKYTPQGGEIFIDLWKQDDKVFVSVKDTGLGIPADDLPHIFEKFYRVNTAVHREQEGTGLGLSIIQVIVQEHGGEVHVDSIEGEGSVFTIELPLII